MAVSSVLAPNGKTYTFEHPDGASQEDLFKFVHQSSQVKPKAQATKPGVVENVARSIPAGAAAAGYDVLGAIGTMALEGLGKYAKAGSDPEYAEKMDQAVRGAQEKVSEYTFDIGATANESFGVDQGRFSADVGGGLGQLPVMILTGGLASVPMSFAEVIKDAEQSLDVKYYDMTEDQKSKVAATGGAYAAFSLAADRIGLKYMGLTKLNKFFDGSETVKGSIVKDVLKGTLGEGLTETSQAVVKDQLARVYDDDREYNIDSVKGYLYEGAVGATVGGIASTGTSVVKNIGSGTSGTKKSDLNKEVEDRPAVEIPRTVQVEYKELDGQVRVVPISITEGQDPMAVAEEALAGRYDPAYGVTVTDQAQPVGPEQELDLPDQAPDATQEEVPVQPEAAVEPTVVEAEAPAVEKAPVEQVLPEVVPQVVPATEQAPAVRGNFRISPRMAKSKPRYRGQPVAYGSELELAVYMAGAKGKNASKVRSELIEAGYSPAEINAMSEEVRAQMKKGYNPNSSKPISVAIAQDVTAEAAGVDRRTMSFKDVTKRTPEIQEQAKILRENIKAGDREQSRAVAQAADEFKPVQSYDFVPAPESNSEMRNALSKDKVNKLNAPVKDGAPVAVRLDIPAYVSTGTWVPVVHEQTSSFRPGTPMSYQATAVVDGATLGIVSDIAVSGIAAGKAKSTIATIKGNLKKVTPTQAKKMADKALKDPSYIQVGMDPERRGYFYNRETMQEVVAGDQAIQIGPLVLVKNPQYGATPSNEWLSLGQDVVAEEGTGLTEQEIKDGQEGEQGLVADTPVTGDVVADAAQFKPSRPVSVPNAPVISRSSLRGKSGFIYFSDRTRVGTYTGLNSESGISIPLQGGMGYAFIPQNVEAEAGWAFTSDNIFTRFNDQLNKTDGIGFVALYTKENLRANNTFLLAYTAELNYALQSGTLTKADFKSEANGLRERALKKKVTNQKTKVVSDYISRDVSWFKLWDKKWNTAEDLQAALNAAGFDTRAYAFSIKKATTKNAKPGDLSGGQLASKRAVKKGFPNVIDMIDLFVEPDLADRERGEIVGAVQFQKGQESAVSASDIGSDDHLSYPLVIRGRGIGVFDSTVNVLDVIKTQKAKNQALRSAETSFPVSKDVGEDVTAQAAQPEVEDRGPRDTYDNGGQVQDAIEQEFDPIGKKINTPIVMRMGNTDYVARYNATRGIIEYNPMLLLKRSKAGVRAAMREEIIHAAMHQVLMVSARKKFSMAEGGKVWRDFFDAYGKTLTDVELSDIKDVYQNIKPEDYVAYGSEYSRAVIQNLLYGEFSEQYQMQSQGGPAWNAIVQLLRSVQAYMAKVLGPMIKTNPEAAQVIVDTVELLKAADPSIRPKSQDVVAQAYDATDKNTAKENTEAGERVGQNASERVRDERKWFESEIFQRDKISKALTPIVTRLRRINVKFARLFSKLEEKIRFRNLKYRKQSVNFFNKLNAIKGNEFLELKQLIFFSPTPQEADSFTSKNRIQRRDALLHKHGLLNMYRLDVQPILEELYIEYNKSGMPDMGYLEDYFPHVINDLNGLIKSYGHKTKRTFEVLVRDENLRRSKITDKNGDPAGLPEMDSEERARFFQDFLQNKLRKDLNGVNIPANAKGRSIVLIPEDKLKFYDDPGQAFGKYTSSMVTALENYKVIGSTNKSGELGKLGQLTEDLFNEGLIDQADVDQLKSLTELATVQFSKENPILRFAGVFTYASTLIDVGTVAVQVLDLYKVLMQRGPSTMLKGVYRTVTGNREYDLERDFGFSKKQIMAEFDDQGFGDKALAFGLRYIVPFQQMDAAMKHSSVEAALIDFLRKAKSDVGSKKYNQLVDELTITLGREDAMKAVAAFRLDRYKDSPEAKAALSEELLQRQPMTYLQVPETYRRNPGSRLFYKLKTFMLLDINFNREMALNDLLGPEKTLKQRTKALKILTSMALALAAIGMPKDMLMDWIRGKDTYLPDHVANALLGIFGLNKYALKTVFESGPIDALADRFTPAAYNIFDNIENDLMSWVNGNKEISEFQMWANAPLFDVWGRFTKKFEDQQKRIRGEKRKQGQRPTIQRF